MEEFIKLRYIALPLSVCGPPTHGYKIKSISDNGYCLASVEPNTSSFEQKPEDFDFQKFAERLLILNNSDLNSILEDLDTKHKVSIKDPKTEEVVTAMETLVACILHAVGEIDPRFKSSCINSGSFYDDLKVGSADEFDFVARLESLSKEGALEARRSERKKGFVYLAVVDKEVQDQFEEFLTKPDNDPCLKTDDVILKVNAFHEYFIELIYSAMKIIDIPDNFIPSNKSLDLEDSNYSWMPFRHGPCATLYLTYICQSSSDAVSIDIDIAPSIAYPGNDYEPPVIKMFLGAHPSNQFLQIVQDISFGSEIMLVPFHFDRTEKTCERSWLYRYSNTWRVSHSSIEKSVFSLFKPNGTEKKLCRILKILKKIYLQGTEEIEIRSNSRPLKLLEPPSTMLTSCTVEQISGFSDESDYEESDDKEYETNTEDDESNDEKTDNEKTDDDGSNTNHFSGSDLNDPFGRKCFESKIQNTKKLKTASNDDRPASKRTDTPSSVKRIDVSPSGNKASQNDYLTEEIIYERVPELHEYCTSPTSFPTNETVKDKSFKVDDEVTATSPKCNKNQEENITSGSVDQSMSFDLNSQDLIPQTMSSVSSNLSKGYSEGGEFHLDLFQKQSKTSVEPSLQEMGNNHLNAEIKYRDSKPLLKTYMIKMLFLAMKMAFPDTERWEPDQLSFLVKMALCMVYYAYSSEEKGILNFWFQDLIENRTRESTRFEILFCLNRLLDIFEKKTQNN